jgi:N utilization substance protein A
LPKDEQIKTEILPLGVKKFFLIKEIIENEVTGKKDIVLSRRDPGFVKQLIIREVPEVANRTVTIERIARTAGERTKVAVFSTQGGIDPVGSCIGQKGSRIQAVLNELPENEKVDVILFSKNQSQFVANALSPAQKVNVMAIERGLATVTVPSDQLALAIGSGGENVRLAGALVGLEIKVTEQK